MKTKDEIIDGEILEEKETLKKLCKPCLLSTEKLIGKKIYGTWISGLHQCKICKKYYYAI